MVGCSVNAALPAWSRSPTRRCDAGRSHPVPLERPVVAVHDEQRVLGPVAGRVVEGVVERVVEVVGAVAEPQHHAGHRVRGAVDLPLVRVGVVVDGVVRVLQAAVEAAVVAPLGQVVHRERPGQRHDDEVVGRPAVRLVLAVVGEQRGGAVGQREVVGEPAGPLHAHVAGVVQTHGDGLAGVGGEVEAQGALTLVVQPRVAAAVVDEDAVHVGQLGPGGSSRPRRPRSSCSRSPARGSTSSRTRRSGRWSPVRSKSWAR